MAKAERIIKETLNKVGKKSICANCENHSGNTGYNYECIEQFVFNFLIFTTGWCNYNATVERLCEKLEKALTEGIPGHDLMKLVKASVIEIS
jgi:hypothetical protein